MRTILKKKIKIKILIKWWNWKLFKVYKRDKKKIISNKFEKQKWKIELKGSNWKKIKILQNDQEQFLKKSKEWRLIFKYSQLKELS